MAPQREWFDTDYYAVLGVASDASDKDVTRAYRKLAKQYHPDANPGNKDAEERFKEVSAANDVLVGPGEAQGVRRGPAHGRVGCVRRRAGWSRWRLRLQPGRQRRRLPVRRHRRPRRPARRAVQPRWRRWPGPRLRRRRPARAARTRPSAAPTSSPRSPSTSSTRCSGITTSVSFTAEAACSECHGSGAQPGTSPQVCTECGGSGEVAMNQGFFSTAQVCPVCHGRGVVIPDPCPRCHGGGTEVRRRDVKVKLPVGVKDGQRIKVAKRGAAGRNGGPPGDLYVVVQGAPARGLRAQGHARPHGARPGHVHRGRARRAGEGADARATRSR